MKAVMLAGDCGYAQSPLRAFLPKGLWPVFDRPAASHLVHQLLALGCDHVGICANGDCRLFAEALDGCVRDATALAFVEDELPRGAAGCAADAASKLGADRFLVLQTNMLWDRRLPEVLTHHLRSGADLTVVVTPDNNDTTLTPVGIYIFEPCVFDFIRSTSYQDIKEQVIPDMIKAGRRVEAFVLPEGRVAWHDAGTYAEALGRALASPQRFGLSLDWMQRVAPSVYVAPGAHISRSARIFGPAAVLSGASIEPDAVLVGPVVVGPRSRVGRSAVVNESILWSRVTIQKDSYVRRSVIGDGAAMSATVVDCFVAPSKGEHGRQRGHDHAGRSFLPPMSTETGRQQRPDPVPIVWARDEPWRRPAEAEDRTEAMSVRGN